MYCPKQIVPFLDMEKNVQAANNFELTFPAKNETLIGGLQQSGKVKRKTKRVLVQKALDQIAVLQWIRTKKKTFFTK